MIVLLFACVAGSGPSTSAASESGGPDSAATADSGDTSAENPPPAPVCTTWADPVQTGTVEDPALEEISGVAPSVLNPDVLWVVEDHGNLAAVYAIDALGALRYTLTLGGVDNVDMEDIDLAPCPEGTCIVVADAGNNEHNRTDLALVVVPEPLLDGVETQGRVPAARYGFTWPEAQDSEALSHTDDGRFILASKRVDKVSDIATVPAYTDGAEATVIATVSSANEADAEGGGAATSLSMWPDQHALLLRSYQHSRQFTLADGIDSLASATFEDIRTPAVPHDEAVAYDAVRRGYWTIPEAPIDGASPIWFVPCADAGG